MADQSDEVHGGLTSRTVSNNSRSQPRKNINAYPRLLAELRAALSDPYLTQKLLVNSGHMIAANAERFEFYCVQTEQQLEPTFVQAKKLHLKGFKNQGFILLGAKQDSDAFTAALFVRIGGRDSRYYGAFRCKAISLSQCQQVYKFSSLSRSRQESRRTEKIQIQQNHVAKATTMPEIGDEGFGASFMPQSQRKKTTNRRQLVYGHHFVTNAHKDTDTIAASAADTMRSIEGSNTNTSDVDSAASTVVDQSTARSGTSREGSQDAAMHSAIRGLAKEEVLQHSQRRRINQETTLTSRIRPTSNSQVVRKFAQPRLPQVRRQPLQIRSFADQGPTDDGSPELGSTRPSTFSILSSTPGPRDSNETPTGRINTSAMTRSPVSINPAGDLDPSRILVEFLSSDNDLLRHTSWQHCSQPEAFFAHALAAFSSLTSETIKFTVFKVVTDGEEKGAFRVMNGVKADFDHLVARVRMFWDQLRADEEGFTVAVSRA